MSLDVYLTMNGATRSRGSGIFVREAGQTREISREEWDEKFPRREPVVANFDDDDPTVFSANITHNLGEMAGVAGIYEALWRPEDIDIKYAGQLVEVLETGLARLVADREKYEAFNPKNGWGDYDGLVKFMESYLAACREYPNAEVSVSR
jgi:hypothetical protein